MRFVSQHLRFFAACEISNEHTKDLFDEINANKNGYISFKEFQNYLEGKYEIDFGNLHLTLDLIGYHAVEKFIQKIIIEKFS